MPLRIVTMVLAGPTLFVAGTPDVADSSDPRAGIEGRRGAELWAVRASDGQRLAQYPLDAPPVFDGMAAARGRLYVATLDGHVLCFLSGSLIEDELFGHEKGAFTGAHTRRLGPFEYASGGTIVLDEVSGLSPAGQVALLRVFETKEVLPLGGNRPAISTAA